MIKTLTSWRGIFALCIVCFHFAMHEFDQMTYAGVTFFFMLSGFLSAMHYDKGFNVKRFYKRRLWRIFPLHWFVLAAMIVLDLAMMHKFSYGWDLPLHVALLQSWVPNPDIYFGYSIHSWFLSALLLCIVLTPLLLRFTVKRSLNVIWIVLLLAACVLIALDLTCSSSLQSYTYVWPLARFIDYSIGIALFLTIDRLKWCEKMQKISTINSSLIEVVALTVLAIFIAIHAEGGVVTEKLENAPLWWIPVALLIVVATVLNGHEGVVGKLLCLKPLLWLGGISFEIYLLQKFVNNAFCYLVAPLFGHYGIMIYDYSFACTLPLLIVTAWIVHLLMKRLVKK